MTDDPVHPDWLDDERRHIDEVVAWVLSPACVCQWEARTGDGGEAWHLVVRRRHCPLHGIAGIF